MNDYIVTVDQMKNNISVLSDSEVSFNGDKLRYELISSGCQSYLLRLNERVYELTSSNVT